MPYQYTEKDSETWILLFLYKNPAKTMDDIVEDGCHKMILKVPFDDLVKLLDKMTESGLIEKISTAPINYVLKARGIHKLKNSILTPLLDLTSEQAHLVIEKIGSSCDTKLLEELYGEFETQYHGIPDEELEDTMTSEKIQIIKRHGLQKLDIILNIVGIINKVINV